MEVTEETFLMIKDCMKRLEKLSPWESRFIQDLDMYMKQSLTMHQLSTLDLIWEKVT